MIANIVETFLHLQLSESFFRVGLPMEKLDNQLKLFSIFDNDLPFNVLINPLNIILKSSNRSLNQ